TGVQTCALPISGRVFLVGYFMVFTPPSWVYPGWGVGRWPVPVTGRCVADLARRFDLCDRRGCGCPGRSAAAVRVTERGENDQVHHRARLRPQRSRGGEPGQGRAERVWADPLRVVGFAGRGRGGRYGRPGPGTGQR